jgi:transposase
VSSLKPLVKAVLRPFVRPVLRPIFRRLDEAAVRLDEVNDLAVRLDRHLPLIENAITSQNADLRASAREQGRIRAEVDQLKDDLVRTQKQIESLRDDLVGTCSIGTPARVELAPADMVGHQPGDSHGESRL